MALTVSDLEILIKTKRSGFENYPWQQDPFYKENLMKGEILLLA